MSDPSALGALPWKALAKLAALRATVSSAAGLASLLMLPAFGSLDQLALASTGAFGLVVLCGLATLLEADALRRADRQPADWLMAGAFAALVALGPAALFQFGYARGMVETGSLAEGLARALELVEFGWATSLWFVLAVGPLAGVLFAVPFAARLLGLRNLSGQMVAALLFMVGPWLLLELSDRVAAWAGWIPGGHVSSG